MKDYFKRLWKYIITPDPNYSEFNDDVVNDYFRETLYEHKKKDLHYCPFCGYGGTPDELNCHLLNRHKK